MTTPQQPRDEVPLDEHLRAALRHAPDHGLSAPSRLSQAILAAAAQLHRPAQPVPAPEPAAPRVLPERQTSWREVLQSLLAPRWAGSIAAGLVAALVVGLWYGEEVPPTAHDDRVAATSPPPAAAPESTQPAPAAVAVPPATQAQASIAVTPAPTTPTPPPRAASPTPPPARMARPESPVDSAPPAAATADAAQAFAKSRTGSAAATATNDAREPAASPLPPAAALRRTPTPPDTGAAGAETRAGERAVSPTPQGPAAASPALTLLRRVRADTESRSAIWTWQSEAGATARSFDAEGADWLQRLVYAARGRWVDVAERSDGATAIEVRWWRNDEPAALLRIEAGGLRWLEPSQRIRHAQMTADELARLTPPR